MNFKNTNGPQVCTFQQALLQASAPDGGLWTTKLECIPVLSRNEIREMRGKSYIEIAFSVLRYYLEDEIAPVVLHQLLSQAYDETIITIALESVSNDRFILRLDRGPTLAFKDYAMRFLAIMISHFLTKLGLDRGIIGATSGDTGPAAIKAFHHQRGVHCFILYARDNPTAAQRRQMTTVGGNTFALQVNDGDFDVCQALMKRMLADKEFACEVFGDTDYFTTANSINLARVLAQIVYHFLGVFQTGD